ncbi:MAG: rhombosortase [endosymbiont of Galathealinum brachiosum]|uniref:Rhombosortase n=1 Tax=endosymbiont of Galathealinum brachiosum TaxID=2200906 RepID=A0A370DCW2_9GAMM|nr:MAG: rhombosortase [endosymbiont of Galathealinum brachiosum]
MNILYKLRSYKLWLVLFILCFFIQALHLEGFFRFDRQLIEKWQFWRLISGHLTHLNWSHFLLNMAGLSMVAIFFSSYKSTTYWIEALLFISLVCSVGMLIDNQLDRYVGFSGVLHGLFIIGARWEMTRYKVSGVVLLTIIIGKIIWEQIFGALPGSESMTGGRVAVNAHLYGAVAGVLFVLRDIRKK